MVKNFGKVYTSYYIYVVKICSNFLIQHRGKRIVRAFSWETREGETGLKVPPPVELR